MNTIRGAWWYILLFLVVWTKAEAQHFSHQVIGPREGMPGTEFYHVKEGPNGYLWISTNHGLVRYDGAEFKTFTNLEVLPGNVVLNVADGPEGSFLLTGLNNQLGCFINGKIEKLSYNLELDSVCRRFMQLEILMDEEANLLLYNRTDRKVWRMKADSVFEPLYHYAHDRDHLKSTTPDYDSSALSFMRFRNGRLFQVWRVRQQEPSFPSDFIRPVPQRDQWAPKLAAVYQDSSIFNVEFAEERYRLLKIDPSRETTIPLNMKITSLFIDREDNLWLTGMNGVLMFANGNIEDPPLHLFKGEGIHALEQDREGTYWFIHQHKGLIRVPSLQFRYRMPGDVINNERISNLKSRQGRLFFSTLRYNFCEWTPNGVRNIRHFEGSPTDYVDFEFDDEMNLLGWDMELKERGEVKVSSQSRFVWHAKRLLRHKDTSYVARYNGLDVFVMDSALLLAPYHSVYQARTYSIERDGRGRIWVGGTWGLYEYDRKRNDLVKAAPEVDELSYAITDVVAAPESNTLFLATRGMGIVIWSGGRECRRLTTEDGLSNDMINRLLLKDTVLYAGTSYGLNVVRINRNGTPDITVFNEYNGLPGNQVVDLEEHGGEVWLATSEGLVSFEPEKIFTNQKPPLIHITRVNIGRKDTLIRTAYSLNEDERDISFAYVGLSYRAGINKKYKYVLEGYLSDTVFSGANFADFTNLPPGQYRFMVWARNDHGIWSSSPAIVSLEIPKVFSETVTAQVLAIVLPLIMFWFLGYRYFRQREERNKLDLQIKELEQKSLSAMMNPHFIYNALNSIQYLINGDQREQANRYLSKFARLNRMNLESLQFHQITLREEINRLQNYLELEQLRFEDRLTCRIIVDPGLQTDEVFLPVMLLQPFVENAIWHGLLPKEEPGTLEIRFGLTTEPGQLRIEIEDDGVGEHSTEHMEHHNSLSRKISVERLHLMEQKTGLPHRIEWAPARPEAEQYQGMKVIIVLPV